MLKKKRCGRDLTPEVRKFIADLSKTGYSSHKVSKLGANTRTINKYFKFVGERGNEENLPKTGSRRKTDSAV